MLRQFGDGFAVIITSLAGCFMLYEPTQVWYLFCTGIFIGTITIRSGSIKSACIMRIIARFVNYMLTLAMVMTDNYTAQLIELTVCGLILLSSIIVYIRLNTRRRWSFDVSSAGTSMTLGEKIRLMLLSPFFWIWVISTLIMSILLVRIL